MCANINTRKACTVNVLVIRNVASGVGDDSIFDFVRKYSIAGDSVTIRSLDAAVKLSKLLEDAERFDFVVACGGDGTVTSVAYELRYTGIPILPFPAGTANLLCMNLFSPNEPHALVNLVDNARTLDFDLGEIKGETGTYGFGIMAGCGYDQLIMSEAQPNKQLLGAAAYFQAAFTNPMPLHANFKLDIDGSLVETDGIGVVFTNFDKIQFDLTVSENNSPLDGKLDIVVLKAGSAIELLPTMVAKAIDRTGNLARKIGGLEVYRGKDIKIEACPRMLMEYDGEPTEVPTPLEVRCLPGACRLLVTQEAYDHFISKDEELKRRNG